LSLTDSSRLSRPRPPAEKLLADLSRIADGALERFLPPAGRSPSRLYEAMRYSVFGGGKRLRPALAILTCDALRGRRENVLPAAAALEMVHTYSLIHDDLPAMDDDDFRRGRPSCHKAFDEATAILAGDGLLTLAFETIATKTADARLAGPLARELAIGAGHAGMVGGQQLDLGGSTKSNPSQLQAIHERKTAALLTAAVRMGAVAGRASPARLASLTTYGRGLGLAFQIVDDILDVLGTAKQLGKTPGKDAKQGKATYPALFGIEESKRRASRLIDGACRAVRFLGKRSADLVAVARYIVERTS
jgi:geranylgeranyl diphosphate synthase type II